MYRFASVPDRRSGERERHGRHQLVTFERKAEPRRPFSRAEEAGSEEGRHRTTCASLHGASRRSRDVAEGCAELAHGAASAECSQSCAERGTATAERAREGRRAPARRGPRECSRSGRAHRAHRRRFGRRGTDHRDDGASVRSDHGSASPLRSPAGRERAAPAEPPRCACAEAHIRSAGQRTQRACVAGDQAGVRAARQRACSELRACEAFVGAARERTVCARRSEALDAERGPPAAGSPSSSVAAQRGAAERAACEPAAHAARRHRG